MWKFGLTVTAVAAIAGTGYVVMQSPRRPEQMTPIITGAASVSPVIARTSPKRDPAPSLTANVAVSCKAAGRRYAELMTQAQQDSLDEVETKYGADIAAGIPGALGSTFATRCETEYWSNEAIRCVLDADDTVTAGFCLRSVSLALISQRVDGAFGIPLRTVPAANLSDRSCAAVAKHWYDLMTPSPEAVANMPTDIRVAVQGFASSKAALLAQIETSCESGRWPDAARRCVLQATTGQGIGPCFHAVTPGTWVTF